MSDYKNTLNLPQTAFPMKANLVQREPLLLNQWAEKTLMKKIKEKRKNEKHFVLHDGPPYANGHLHCGHALNKILKDIINKSKWLSGFDAPFVPGWDCHGLPIELNVEKKVGKPGKKLSIRDFRDKCRAYANTQIDIQRQEFKRLGVFGEWDQPYITMDYAYEANVVRALGKIMENGHLHQGFKPVHWCIACGSALAEAEVEFEEKTSTSIDVAFFADAPENFLAKFKLTLPVKSLIVPIWTTTPWSLPGNEAVCLNPSTEYVLVDTSKHYFLVAKDLVPSVMARYALSDYRIVAESEGASFEHLQVKHPFLPNTVPIILGEHVTTDSGTGCVHTAPAHGPDDYQVGQAYALPLLNPIGSNGCYKEATPFVGGLFIWNAEESILNLLRENDALLHQETIKHSYAHCWRHKTPMIYLATPQWFISMDKNGLREKIAAQVKTVNWIPKWGEARILDMVNNRPDWCISRQRSWGTPMPLFIHKDTRALHPNSLALLYQVADLIEQKGADAWFELPVVALLGEDAASYEKITDTLDVWFDSGVSHFCVLKDNPELGIPADIFFEGSDQYRGWFNSSITTAVAIYGQAPYKTVLTHGYTVDADGRKLSKSQGNYIALDKLLDTHGADILRLWVSSTDYRHEVSISEEIIKRNADAYRRIRNTARFLLANLFDFSIANAVSNTELVELDRWAIKRAQELQKEIIEAYNTYQFHVIYQKIHNFCAIDMGSFYLDVIKDRQYTTPKNSVARRSCQTAIYHIVQALTRWLAPILSFTAEEIWQYIPNQSSESIFLEKWYKDWPLELEVDMETWDQLQYLRNEVNKAIEGERKQGVLGSALAANVCLYVEKPWLTLLKKFGEELRFILITSQVEIHPINEAPTTLKLTESGLGIVVQASSDEKCERCWHRRHEVGTNEEHPNLCNRCIGNITEHEERRIFA